MRRPRNSPATTRMHAVCQAIIDYVRSPLTEIICVDCGGTAHLITPPREDNAWEVGEFVAYRCSDCLDRWDLQLTDEDLHDVDPD